MKLLEQRDQAASAMLRSLLSSPPPAVVAGAASYQKASSGRQEALFADSGGRDFGGDSDADWTGLEPINAFRPAAPPVNEVFPDYFTFYSEDAVRTEGGLADSKFPYKNGTVSTLAGNYNTPFAFASALRDAIASSCGSQLSKSAGTSTYDLKESRGVEVFAWDSNTAVGIGGPNPNASIGLNTILTGCVRLAYENLTAVAPGKGASDSGSKADFWTAENITWVAVVTAIALGVLYLCAKAEPGAVKKGLESNLKALKSCCAKRPVVSFDRNGDGAHREAKNSRLTIADPNAGPQPFAVPRNEHVVDVHENSDHEEFVRENSVRENSVRENSSRENRSRENSSRENSVAENDDGVPAAPPLPGTVVPPFRVHAAPPFDVDDDA